MSSTHLRALCPSTCHCYSGFLSRSGLFGTSAFGCPTECLKLSPRTAAQFFGETFPCEDTGPGNFSAQAEYMPPLYKMLGHWSFAFRDYYHHYVDGLKEYVTSDLSIREGIHWSIPTLLYWKPGIQWPDQDALIAHVVGGAFFQELYAGSWTIFPGIPHPRSLTGCEYLASFEITFLINVDLCAGGKIASIRPWCPRACGCSQGMRECPGTCA